MTRYRTGVPNRSVEGDVRIVQVSDLHAKQFGRAGAVLTERIHKLSPDVIAVTGDLLDFRRRVKDLSISLVADLHSIAPVYFVTGNHEFRSREWVSVRDGIQRFGATVLDNRATIVNCSRQRTFTMAGVDDFTFFGKSVARYRSALDAVGRATADLPRPIVLLAHRPEHFAFYVDAGFDVILSGHAHGGQIRIPGIGPLFAPDEGIFPKHAEGIHRINGSCLVVSRGLGPSRIPLRIFNRPELVVVDVAL